MDGDGAQTERGSGGLHGFLEEMYGRLFRLIATIGLPPSFIVLLETRGRRSGKRVSTVLISADHEGDTYLVSLTGPRCDWLANARAHGGKAVLRHGKRRRVVLQEVVTEQRPPILKAYLKWSLGARAIIEVSHKAPVDDFQRVAAKYPVFRVVQRE